jgi:hypothetical protein
MSEQAAKQTKPQSSSSRSASQQETAQPELYFEVLRPPAATATGQPLTPDVITQLQSVIGNHALQRLADTEPTFITPRNILPRCFTGGLAPTVQRQDEDESEPHHAPPARIGGGHGPRPITPLEPGLPVRTVAPLAGEHTTPEEADAAIRRVLGVYVQQAIREGRQITNLVYVVDDETWDRAWRTRYGHEGMSDPRRTTVSGWVDRDMAAGTVRVWIHRDRETPGTVIHEAIHLYHSITSVDALTEGITEYFTQRVVHDLGLTSPVHYPEETHIIDMLVSLVGEPVVANAYFNNAVPELIQAYAAVRSEADWHQLIRHMQREEWDAAELLVQRP